jgi:hypothetical protein
VAGVSGHQVKAYCWLNVTEDDDCLPITMADKGDKTFEVHGDFGTLGEVHCKGTIDPSLNEFLPLRAQHNGQFIVLTGPDIVAIVENTAQVCPLVAAGTGVNVSIWILGREDN